MFLIKLIKKTSLFFVLINCSTINPNWAKSIINKETTYEDFEHPNRGCPENSLCSPEMGEHRKKWLKLLGEIKKQDPTEKKKIQLLEKFRQQHGLPVAHFSYEKYAKDYDQISWSSNCKEHLETKTPSISYGLSFISELKKNQTPVVHSLQKIMFASLDEVKLDKVFVYLSDKKLTFYIPHAESPILLKDNKLFFIRSDEDVFYGLSISSDGKWEITNSSDKNQSRYFASTEETNCPENNAGELPFFKSRFCRKIYNEETREMVVIELPWSC